MHGRLSDLFAVYPPNARILSRQYDTVYLFNSSVNIEHVYLFNRSVNIEHDSMTIAIQRQLHCVAHRLGTIHILIRVNNEVCHEITTDNFQK